MTSTPLGTAIQQRMLALGLNQRQLSRKAGLGATYVRDIINGRSKNPRSNHLEKIAEVLDCDPLDLFQSKLTKNLLPEVGETPKVSEGAREELASSLAFTEFYLGEKRGAIVFRFAMRVFQAWSLAFPEALVTDAQVKFMLDTIAGVFASTRLSQDKDAEFLDLATIMMDFAYQLSETFSNQSDWAESFRRRARVYEAQLLATKSKGDKK